MRRSGLILSLVALASTVGVHAGPPTPPQPPAPPRQPVRVEVKQGDDNQSMVFVRSGGGDSHAVKLHSQDGKVIVEAEPNPDRPWLGVLLDDSKMMGDDERSATVLSVADGSPAARGGLRRGDVITGIDGKTLAQRGNQGLLGGHRPGERVKLQVERDGRSIDVPISLESRPTKVEFEDAEGMNAFAFAGDSFEGLAGLEALESLKGLSTIPCPQGSKCPTNGFMFSVGNKPRLGVIVESMPDQLAKYFGTEPGKGVLVKDVVEGSAAEKAGLEAGDVILRIGDTDIGDVGDVNDAIDAMKEPGEVDIDVLRRGSERTLRANITDVTRRGALMPTEAWPKEPWEKDMAPLKHAELERLAEELAAATSALPTEEQARALAEASESLRRVQADLERAHLETGAAALERQAAELQRQAAELDEARAEQEEALAEQAEARAEQERAMRDMERELARERERLEEEKHEAQGASPSRTGRPRGSRSVMPTHGAFQRSPSAPRAAVPGSSAYLAQ